MSSRGARGWRGAAVALMATAAVGASVLGGSPAAGAVTSTQVAVPVPESDPFYTVPANVADFPDGHVFASRPITALAYGVPLPVQAWQLQYRSEDSQGSPTADVTTIMVPLAPWTGSGPRPVVSYQTAEDGVAGKCSPSYALRAGLATSSNSEAETGLMALAITRGWTVVAPDYEGPYSEFIGGPGEAHGVLDSLRAIEQFAPDGVTPKAPIGMWGYSGGSVATSEAAELQPTYAPDVHVAGIATGGLVADIASTINDFSGSAFGGAIPMGINGVLRAYPQYNLEQYLSPTGLAQVRATAGDCINDAVLRYPFDSIQQVEAFPGAMNLPVVQHLLKINSPNGIDGIPAMPVYDYHAVLDELAPIAPDRSLMRAWCSAGVVVEHREDLLGEHGSETVTGALGALQFLSDRFGGAPPVNTCASIPQ